MQKKTETLEDLLHFYFSEVVASFPHSARKNLYGASFFEKTSNAFMYFLRSLKELIRPKKPKKTVLQGKNWLYVIGDNNYNSLQFLETKVTPAVYVTPFRYQRNTATIYQLSHPTRLFYLFLELPTFFKLLRKRGSSAIRCWDAVFRATGMYSYSRAILKQYAPNSIVFSNDMSMEPRALILAAQSLGIPTFFIQHACVRADFPPLKFHYSFLEGQDALDKYKESGPIDGKVQLIGVPKLDPYLKRKRKRTSIQNVGICSNLLDSVPAIESLLETIFSSFPDCQITYRHHPGDKRKTTINSGILISNSREINAYEFLLQQDLIIAGNTSIHYEAAMLNVHSIYYKFDESGAVDDLYRFVKNGLVKKADGLLELVSLIKEISEEGKGEINKANYYNALLNTKDEGKSQELVVESIQKILINFRKKKVV